MVTGAYLLLAAGGILALGGWVMLLVLGFKKSIGWGFAILFLSWLVVPLVVFLVKYWGEAKTGLLLLVAGTVASGIGYFAVVGSEATSAMGDFETFGLAPTEVVAEETPAVAVEEEALPPAGEDATAIGAVAAVGDAGASGGEVPAPLPTPAGAVLGARVEWLPLADLAGLPAYLGELIELHMRDGSVRRVTLDAIEGDHLQVTQRVGGGALSYAVDLGLVAEIQVAK
ncbi:MAG TPA: hypothetical protein PKJ99_01385 [Thermoanaerobaculales bacterium]|nr:hypothetical protein [Thermoanaerobaculales bacterium]HPA79662.1 hypothetical protein [Thermoanaerobaculales bacterium]HQL28969.1 hypothetical protein [Thermoanaerobaculales bacterium]HQN96265.1 hypothetical protein [Thermoanaerobaculales bacterium]